MRQLVATIILIVFTALGAIALSYQLGTFLPASLAAMSAVAFYSLGHIRGRKSALRENLIIAYRDGWQDGAQAALNQSGPHGPDTSAQQAYPHK